MPTIKNSVRWLLQRMGYDIVNSVDHRLLEPDWDLQRFIHEARPVILDVGANVGQSVVKFKGLFPNAVIHSFEPSPETFTKLQSACSGYEDVYLNNLGVGNKNGESTLMENSETYLSSFLPLSESGFGRPSKQTPVLVTSLDSYCEERNIRHIDLLKTDTQGFDLAVLKGATNLLTNNHVKLVLTEINFTSLYQTDEPFYAPFEFLQQRGFRFVAFYKLARHRGMAGWCDALFINPNF